MNQEKSEHGVVKVYKVCRIFNLAHRNLLLFMGLLVFIVTVSTFNAETFPMIVMGLIMLFLIVFLMLKDKRYVTLREDTISYQENVFLKYEYRTGGKYIEAEFTISYITQLELAQTRFEQCFNMGHIRLKGHTEVKARERYVKQLSERNDHVVYGILNFSDFCKVCHKQFSNAIK